MVECKLADMSPTTFAAVLNNATVVEAGASPTQPATSTISLKRGTSVATFAVLVRGLGPTPATSAFNAQFQIPSAIDTATQKPAAVKGAPMLLDVQFELLEDDSADPELIIQTGAHS